LKVFKIFDLKSKSLNQIQKTNLPGFPIQSIISAQLLFAARKLFPLSFIAPAQQHSVCGLIDGPSSLKATVPFFQPVALPPPLLVPSRCAPLLIALLCSAEDETKCHPTAFLFPIEPPPRRVPFVFETTNFKAHSPATVELLRPAASPLFRPYKWESHLAHFPATHCSIQFCLSLPRVAFH
jgi:hypothetical protein